MFLFNIFYTQSLLHLLLADSDDEDSDEESQESESSEEEGENEEENDSSSKLDIITWKNQHPEKLHDEMWFNLYGEVR